MSAPLRIVTFNTLPSAYEVVHAWAAAAGHTVILAVTSPGPKARRSEGYREITAMAGAANVELLCTTRIKSVVTPVLTELKPDLIVSFTFPWRLPPELLATARLGAINLHPALLPAYRGPNVMRQFFDAAPRIGATLHRMDNDFDTGPILAQVSAPLPRPCRLDVAMDVWGDTMKAALAEGAQRAFDGHPGTPQLPGAAPTAHPFTDAEYWLDPTEPAYTLQCKAMALGVFATRPVRACIGNEAWTVTQIDLLDATAAAAPGSVIDTQPDGLIVQTGDGLARLHARRERAA